MDENEYWKCQFEATEEFCRLCPPDVQKRVVNQVSYNLKSHPDYSFTSQDKYLWDRLIASNPILERVIYYTFIPPERIDIRRHMLAVWQIGSEAIPDWINFSHDTGYIHYVLQYPELKDRPLLKFFLVQLYDHSLKFMTADNQ